MQKEKQNTLRELHKVQTQIASLQATLMRLQCQDTQRGQCPRPCLYTAWSDAQIDCHGMPLKRQQAAKCVMMPGVEGTLQPTH